MAKLTMNGHMITVDAAVAEELSKLIASDLFVLTSIYHDGSKKRIPQFSVKDTGQLVSIQPMLGVQANAKATKRLSVFDLRRRGYPNTKKHITPFSFEELVKWLNHEVRYEWDSANRIKHNIQLHCEPATVTQLDWVDATEQAPVQTTVGVVSTEPVNQIARIITAGLAGANVELHDLIMETKADGSSITTIGSVKFN